MNSQTNTKKMLHSNFKVTKEKNDSKQPILALENLPNVLSLIWKLLYLKCDKNFEEASLVTKNQEEEKSCHESSSSQNQIQQNTQEILHFFLPKQNTQSLPKNKLKGLLYTKNRKKKWCLNLKTDN